MDSASVKSDLDGVLDGFEEYAFQYTVQLMFSVLSPPLLNLARKEKPSKSVVVRYLSSEGSPIVVISTSMSVESSILISSFSQLVIKNSTKQKLNIFIAFFIIIILNHLHMKIGSLCCKRNCSRGSNDYNTFVRNPNSLCRH